MYRRRNNLYSRIEAIQEGRRAIWEIFVLVLLVGILINLISDPISRQIDAWIDDSWNLIEIAIFVLAIAIVLGICYFFLRLFFQRVETQWVQVEILLPYLFKYNQGIQVPKPVVEFNTFYYVPAHVSDWFNQKLPFGRSENKEIEAEWRQLKLQPQRARFNSFMREKHEWLVNVAILYALLDYGKKSLGSSSNYYWEHSPLSSREINLQELAPSYFSENPFIQEQARRAPEQKLLLPKDTNLTVHVNKDKECIWTIAHTDYGELNICISPYHRARNDQTLTQILRKGHNIREEDEFWVMATRIDMRASFRLQLNKLEADLCHNWLTRLLSFLEESLDWYYYLQRRLEHILLNFPDAVQVTDTDKEDVLLAQLEMVQHQLQSLRQQVENKVGTEAS